MKREKKALPEKVGIKFKIGYNKDVMAKYWMKGENVRCIIKAWAKIFAYLDQIIETKYSYGPGKCLQIEHDDPDIWVTAEIDFLDNMAALIDAAFKDVKRIELWVRFTESRLAGKIIVDRNTICLEGEGIIEAEIERVLDKDDFVEVLDDDDECICPAQIKAGGY